MSNHGIKDIIPDPMDPLSRLALMREGIAPDLECVGPDEAHKEALATALKVCLGLVALHDNMTADGLKPPLWLACHVSEARKAVELGARL